METNHNVREAIAAPRIVDVHAHVTPPRYLEEAGNRIRGPLRTWSIEKHLEDMDKGGVEYSILSLSNPGVSFDSPESARRFAGYTNEYLATLVRDRGGQIGAFTCLPLPDIDGSLLEIERAFSQYGFNGVGLFTNYNGKWLGDSYFNPVFEELNRRKAVVYVHPIAAPCCSEFLPYLMDAAIEFGTDTTRAITNFVYLGAARRFPDVTMIWSHAGGTMPFLIERFDVYQTTLLKPELKMNFPDGFRAEVKRFFYDTAQASNAVAMTALNQVVSSNQIVFGSDFPFRTTAETVEGLVKSAVFDSHDLGRILWDNAATVLNLPVRP
jgi:6-methylsalicylate decarboxylase